MPERPESPPQTSPSLADGVALPLARLDAESAALAEHAARMERAELALQRIEAALDALLPALGSEARRPIAAPQAAALAFLAAREPPRLAVADQQKALRAQGHALARTYASKLLKKLEALGVVAKAGHGRYRVNRAHPDILRRRVDLIDSRLDALADGLR